MGLCYFRRHLDLHKKGLIVYLMEKYKSRNQRREHNPLCSLTLDRETTAHLDQWEGRRTMSCPTLRRSLSSQPCCQSWSSGRVLPFPKLSPRIHCSPVSHQAARLLGLLSCPMFSVKETKRSPGISPLPSVRLCLRHSCPRENPSWHSPPMWPAAQLDRDLSTWALTQLRWLSASPPISVSLTWPIL